MYTTQRPVQVSEKQVQRVLNQHNVFESAILNNKSSMVRLVGEGANFAMDINGYFVASFESLYLVGQKDVKTGETLWSSEVDVTNKTLIERGSSGYHPNHDTIGEIDIMKGRFMDITKDIQKGEISSVAIIENGILSAIQWHASQSNDGTIIVSGIDDGRFLFDHMTTVD